MLWSGWSIPLLVTSCTSIIICPGAKAFAPTLTITSSSPSPHATARLIRRTSRNRSPSSPTCHNVVFTRLSEDCVTALDIAQEQASLLHQIEVDDTFMLLGICDKPGRTKSTLEKYGINWQSVRRILNYLVTPKDGSDDSDGNKGRKSSIPRLKDFAAKNKDSLPYSKSLQDTLFSAGAIAQTMGSSSILPEHIFLALLDYKEIEETGEAQAASRDDECEAMEIIWHLDATLEGEDICFDLLTAMMEESPSSNDEAEAEQKDGRGGSSEDKKRVPTAQSTEGEAKTGSSLMEECGSDLTQQAKNDELDVVSGRGEEIESVLRILLRRRKNNPCLIGEPGVGKTSIAEGLAQILVSDSCPALLKGHRIISLEVAALVAGTQYRGDFEARFRAIMKELAEDPVPTILFIDEIHTLVGAGSTDGSAMDAASLLKPYLARGKIRLMGATTISEYQKFVAKDAALERRLQPVLIEEPSVEQTVGILESLVPFYQSHHRVEYTHDALEAAAKLSDRYIADRFLPDKAIDVMDEAGAIATLKRVPNEPPPEVNEDVVTSVISKLTNIPVGNLEMDEMSRLNLLEETLTKQIKGQERAVKSVAKAIRRARSGIRNPNRPIASLLFCGPTGTGKTALCKTLAQTYYGSEKDLIRLDMSEFMSKESVSRLTGPPPGYAGYEEGGQLTEAVRRDPHSVVLLDELEKAHGEVLNILLQVMEDGILTDGQGRSVSFKNVVLIMTSNIGSKRILDLTRCSGEDEGRPKYTKLAGAVRAELEATLRPEFLNRYDEIVIFAPLSPEQLELIAAMMVVDITVRAQIEKNISASVSPALLHKMTKDGSRLADQFGARPMRRAVQRLFEDCLSDAIVQGFIREGDDAAFDLDESEEPSRVTVTRSRDDEVLSIDIEDSATDIAAVPVLDNEDNDVDEEEDIEPNGAGLQRAVAGE